MKGYIIKKALKYLRGQLPDLREFWRIALANNWVNVANIGDLADCAFESVKFVLKHGTPNEAKVRDALRIP